ncbi:hypothetical protein BBP40_008454 [Aspergillus hancockii]|nr:hypothetical protein BBP40_008454 [Aspergillus hancockii]
MSSNKPTLVLVTRAWYTPKSYSKFTKALRSAGYEVHVLRLPSMNGAQPANADLTTDTDLICTYVESFADAGRTIIEGFVSAVSHLVYMCASAFKEGACVVDQPRTVAQPEQIANASDFFSILGRPGVKSLMVGDGADEAESEALVETLTRWNGDAMYQPLVNCAWRVILSTYLLCRKDLALPLEFQRSMVETIKAEGAVLESGHSPHLPMTEEMVRVIDDIVAKQI